MIGRSSMKNRKSRIGCGKVEGVNNVHTCQTNKMSDSECLQTVTPPLRSPCRNVNEIRLNAQIKKLKRKIKRLQAQYETLNTLVNMTFSMFPGEKLGTL